MTKGHPRILLAKIGLDGHDRGVKVLARSFRDAGFEVIYTGLWQTSEATMLAALQEDVDVVGVSLLSAAHLTVMPELLRFRRELQIDHVPIVLGGIVPEEDHPKLREMGVAAVFNPGSPLERIIATIQRLAGGEPADDGGSASSTALSPPLAREQESKRLATADLIRAYQAKDARALAKLITAVQRGVPLDGWKPPQGKARIIGVTGAPGVGKSSFIARLSKLLRSRGHRVAVVAIDPSSPVTGGALLGDRLRMMSGKADAEFFVRSMSSGDAQGGLAPKTREVVEVLSGFGFDFVLVETVGAGQSDVAIREVAQKVILLLMPDSGDSVQFSKAGIMEIAHCFVLNKCDLAGADATQAQLLSAVGDSRPIFKVSAVRDEGIEPVAAWAADGMANSE
jgi:LAO/AO transport system ATPase